MLMGKSAAVTGGIGDVVYSIPVIRKLNITTLFIKENFYGPGLGSMYSVCKPLLESQGIECLPTVGGTPFSVFEPGLHFDYDLDAWRCRPGRDRVHIIKNMCLHYRISTSEWNKPFLQPWCGGAYDPNINNGGNLIFLTQRWRENSKVDWRVLMKDKGLDWSNTHFIGHPEDYSVFCNTVINIAHVKTDNLLAMTSIIWRCKALYCNQGVALTIAQGLGKPYWLEVKPGKSNTLFYTPNEHILK